MSATSGNVHHCGPQLQSKQQVRWQDTGVAHEAGTDLGGPHRECMWQRSWLPPPSQSAFAQSHHWPRSTPVSVSHLLHVCCCGKDCCCMPALYPALAPTWYIAWPGITISSVYHAQRHTCLVNGTCSASMQVTTQMQKCSQILPSTR